MILENPTRRYIIKRLSEESEIEGEAMETTMEVDGSGALDIENYQMQMAMTMNAAVPGEDDTDIGMEMYLVDNTYYILTDALGMGPAWMKFEMPMESWEQMNQIESQVELLEAAEVEVIGSETVNGIDCYVVEVTPDVEQLWEMASQQALLTEEMPNFDEELLDEMLQEYSVKQWIAKDSHLIMKVEMEMNIEVTPEAMGYPEEEGGITIDMAMTMLVNDYNQPVSIELPPEAENAMDIMDFMDYMDY